MNNLMVQNFIANKKSSKQKTIVRKSSNPVNYKNFKVNAHPLAPHGRLVGSSLFGIKGLFSYNKKINPRYSNEVNDYKLGKFNDVAMRASATVLAGYLAIQRALPVKKGMEFLGAGAFFASMTLWPKALIQAPIQARYGFNVNQKWQDERGRTNDFFRNQHYIPWDLMSNEYINKVGDKMGVPKDMDNREYLIKDKMKKIAVQSNTLWMLSAGFATPIVGALIASQLEEPLGDGIEKIRTNKVVNDFANINNLVDSKLKGQDNTALVKLLEINKDKPIEKNIINKIVEHMQTSDMALNKAIEKDVNALVKSQNVKCVSSLFDSVYKSNTFEKLGITRELISNSLKEVGLESVELNDDAVSKIKSELNLLRMKNIAGVEKSEKHHINLSFSQILDDILKPKDNNIISENEVKKLINMHNSVAEFNAREAVISDFNKQFLGNKEDSVIAKKWNKSIRKIVKSLGFNSKELDLARMSTLSARNLIDTKFIQIAADENRYNQVMGKIIDIVVDFEKSVHQKHFDINGTKVSFFDYVSQNKDYMFDEIATTFSSSNGEKSSVARYINGSASAKNNAREALQNTLDGSSHTIYKFITTLDLYKRIEEGSVASYINERKPYYIDTSLKITPKISAQIEHNKKFEETVWKELKRVALQGSIGEHVVKFDIQNKEVYKTVMGILFDNEGKFSTEFEKISGEKAASGLVDRLNESLNAVKNDLADYYDKYKQGHQFKSNHGIDYFEAEKAAKRGMSGKQSRLGEAIGSTFKSSVEPIINTKKWNKMFVGAGAALVGITLITPLFFGKIKSNGGNK